MEPVTLENLAASLDAGRARAIGVTPTVAALVATRLPGCVIITPDDSTARAIARDARLLVDSGADIIHVAQNPSEPYAELSSDLETLGARLAALYRLATTTPRLVTLSAESLLRRVIPKDELLALSRSIAVGDELDTIDLATYLISAGYRRIPVVDDAGSFAIRGDIVDVFPPLAEFPLRLELFGDEVESIRRFDPHTQRTLRTEERVDIHPSREVIATGGGSMRARLLAAGDEASHPSRATRELYDSLVAGEDFVGIEVFAPAFHERLDPVWTYLPDDAPVIVLDPDEVHQRIGDRLVEAGERYRARLADRKIAFPPAAHYATADDVAQYETSRERLLSCPRLELETDEGEASRVASSSNRALSRTLESARHTSEPAAPLIEAFGQWRQGGQRVILVSASENRSARVIGLLKDSGIEVTRAELPISLADVAPGGSPVLYRGRLSTGVQLPTDGLVILTDDDLFGERRRTSSRQRRAAERAKEALLGSVSDFSQLGVGDFLVHQSHGVGRYQGLAKLPVGGVEIDFLNVEYVGGTLYLPVFRIGEVQRYVGAEGHKARLDRLGGVSWAKTQTRVRRDVAALAEALLQLYAQRAALAGRAFPPSDAMFRDFEATFEFEETPDQAAAISAVLADMEKPRPMDRLVCGDVGYGKTEVALRAILKAALGGVQVAMLAPTTVLVEQHYQTMLERFADWPVTIAKLSRFQKRGEQMATLRGIADGSVDAVVGTHRLLSKDVRWKDLGLAIVDEEQRFGVVHKERLKVLRTQIDMLTLTATPIPRTLHLAMAGLRDLSIIATPPADRRSIRTFIARAEDGVLREGIRRELGRGGQVFFVVPRIEAPTGDGDSLSLEEWADRLRELVPTARVTAAHGQMSGDSLERAMVTFVAGDADILVSTTIVESGLDIARANTMFIADADRFGLAQLYQLRGRVGRSKERAFCYLLIPPERGITDDAKRRLETLQRFTDLGAGFMIASQDLEIRGAGELLGSKQSGFIAAVGFDAYTQMLEEAVGELRGEAIHRHTDPELTVDVPGYIPDDYIEDTGQRLTFYKRLSGARDDDEISELLGEITDRYGPLPGEVILLGELMALKASARRIGADSLDLSGPLVTLAFGDAARLDAGAIAALVGADDSRFRLTPDMRLQYRLTDEERTAPTAAAKRCLLQLEACVTPAKT